MNKKSLLFFIFGIIIFSLAVSITGLKNCDDTKINILQQSEVQKININTCSKEALESLPEIGEVLAERIINNRPYKDVYELDKVKGIGPETINVLKEQVTCN
jgi:DNA uptake protein ComE-like DNA-binding protein